MVHRWCFWLAVADFDLHVTCPGGKPFEAWLVPAGLREVDGVEPDLWRPMRQRAVQAGPGHPFEVNFTGLSPFRAHAVEVQRIERGQPCAVSSELNTSKIRLLGTAMGALAIACAREASRQRMARLALAAVFVVIVGVVLCARWGMARSTRPSTVVLTFLSLFLYLLGSAEVLPLLGLREEFGSGHVIDRILVVVLGLMMFVGVGVAMLFEERLSRREGVAAVKVAVQSSGLALLAVSLRMLYVTLMVATIALIVDYAWEIRDFLYLETCSWIRSGGRPKKKKTVRILTPSMRPPPSMTPSGPTTEPNLWEANTVVGNTMPSSRKRAQPAGGAGAEVREERPSPSEEGPPSSVARAARAAPDKIYNYETGRMIAVGGSTYKRLLRAGYEVDLDNGLISNPKPRSFSLDGADASD